MGLFDALPMILKLLPGLYAIGTRIRVALDDVSDDENTVETVYTILDAVSDIVNDIRNSLPPRPIGRVGSAKE